MSEFVTAHRIREMLAENIDGLSRVDMSTMGLEVFPRLMEMLSKQADCPVCQRFFDDLMVYARDVRLIFNGSKQQQMQFQKFTNEAIVHLKREHGIRARGQLRALYLFWSSIVGITGGGLSAYLFFPQAGIFQSSLLGWICAVMIGWVLGTYQERQLMKNNRLF